MKPGCAGPTIILAAALALGGGCSAPRIDEIRPGRAETNPEPRDSNHPSSAETTNDYASLCRAVVRKVPATVHLSTGETVMTCTQKTFAIFDIAGVRRYTFPRWELLQSVKRYRCMNLAVNPDSGDCAALEALLDTPGMRAP